MTYSSRNFLISWGVGSDERVPRFSNRLSSAMMSLRTSTHSSQMKTVGPAISLRTSFWSLLQKEQRRTSDSPFFFTALSLPAGDHLIHDTIFLRLDGIHDEVAIGVACELLHGLLRVEGEYVVQAVLDPQDLLGLDGDIGGLPLGSSPGLVDQDAGVGQREALAVGPGGEEHGAHAGGLTHADRLDVGPDELHGVVDGHPRRGGAARRVDVDVDVLLGVFSFEEEELRDDQVGHHVVDGRPEEDDVVLEEAR